MTTTTSEGTLDRWVARAVNGLEVARFGGLRTDEAPAPYDVVAHEPVYRLRHYHPDEKNVGAPVLLVPPLMQVADVWDISPATSAVTMLSRQGLDPWVVDFGDPAVEPGGTERDFGDHVLALVDAIDRVREATGQDVHIGGYSQGGVFCYVAAAYRACEGVASIFVLGSPIEALPVEAVMPAGLFWEAARLQGKVLGRTGLPKWAVGPMFNMANPVRTVKNDLDFFMALHDRESLLSREPQRKFLKKGAWIGWSGPAISDVVDMLVDNRLREGGLVIGDRTVGLADLDCPILVVVGEADSFAPAPMVRKIVTAAPKAEVWECTLPVGHFGLPVSSHAKAKTWPGVAAWVRRNSGGEQVLPDFLHRLTAEDLDELTPGTGARGLLTKVTYTLGSAAEAGLAMPTTAAQAGQRLASAARALSAEAVAQAPRILRLERMAPHSRVSYAGMLADAAASQPDHVAFLHGDRAQTHATANARIDNVVRGLLSVGVRRGEHVGVLMDMRPSALVTVAALNRIGAVAVMVRPGENVTVEAALGRVTRLVADPEHAEAALDAGVPVLVLGGGAGPRVLPSGVLDLEQVDPAAVELPSWYRPNPGRARDLAFVLFTGRGEHTRADRITNGRWATSALAAATAAALTPSDTVYSVSPLHHPSGLLLTTAATTASRARLAMADRFDASTFWSEVRRYGVTVVPYTWTMLHELVTAPPVPEERSHPIRLFVGSGMPAGLWRRVESRFGPAVVLELYASTRSGAMLGNVRDRKLGAVGRPLPGTPRVRVVEHDLATGLPATGPDGYAVMAAPGRTGLLVVEARTGNGGDGALRGMFAPGDAWRSSGDLFRIDDDGDLWYVDSYTSLIRTGHGTVSPRTVETALGSLDAVDLAACYPLTHRSGGEAEAHVAVTLRPGRRLTTPALNRVLGSIEPGARPDSVLVVESVPLTSWFRPSVPDLQAGHAKGKRGPTWRLSPRTGRYTQDRG
jgi:putative long chain acyl-CoA synthase